LPRGTVLSNYRRALEGRKGGRLIIVDAIVPETSEPHFSKILDLEMPLMPGGRERTEIEWRDLFEEAGLEIARIIPMQAAESVIEVQIKP
jgi:hypothetical protein